jgi:hypothetical protein
MHNRKSKIAMSIAFNMHTQRISQHHKSESKLHVLIQDFCTWVFQIQLSASSPLYALCSIDYANVTMIQDEGVYSRFSLLRSKLSNLHLNLPTHINCVLMPSPTTDESDRSRYVYNI